MSGDLLDLDAIEARALAFPEYDREWHTDGPWWQGDENGVATGDSMVSGFERCAVVTPPPPLHQRLEPVSYVMEHIAGMDPATTLALVAEVRRLRATNARLNRRCQIAESAINELTTTTGRGRARPVAAEVWERCQRSHDNAHHPADATEAQ